MTDTSILVEGQDRVYLGGQAWLVEEDRELAWAEKHVIKNPALKYVLGRFVEAGNPNENGHIFDLDELGVAQQYLANSPLNLLHRPHYIVGNYVASELMYPVGATAADNSDHPYMEALSAFYRYYFPEEFLAVEKAHADGSLFYSMECVPRTVACKADDGCGLEFAYDGRTSPTYCAHLNEPSAKKLLHQPLFTGGALILPPTRPGWKRADITSLSSLIAERQEECESAYEQIKEATPHLEDRRWEAMMAALLRLNGDRSTITAAVMPVIETEDDLRKAIANARTAEHRAHVTAQAKRMGKTSMLPDSWNC